MRSWIGSTAPIARILPSSIWRLQPFHNRFDWRGGVVVVEQIQVDEVGAERLEGCVQVARYGGWRKPVVSQAAGMTSLADDHYVLAVPACPNPGAQRPFAVTVYARLFECVASEFE